LFTYDVESDDDDFRTLNPSEVHTYSLDVNPEGMTIDELTGLISWTPTNEQAEGKHDVTVKVTDADLEVDTQTFTVSVENVNDEPSIISEAILNAVEEEVYSYDVDSDDDDFRTMNPTEIHTFSLDTAPEGMTIDSSSGLISWTPTNEQSEGEHEITVKITDKEGVSDTQTFILTVENVNDLPIIVSSAILDATEEILYEYNVDSDDDDFRTLNPSDVHTYSLDLAPDGMAIDSSTGLITWIPTNEQSEGTHTITMRVTDISGIFDTQTYEVSVENVNDLPEIISIPVTDATEEVLYTYDLGSDDDDFRTLNPSEVHTYSLTLSPDGMVIDGKSGLISWTPSNEQSEGTHTITVKVTDIAGISDNQTYEILVENVNDEPIINSTSITDATEEILYTYDLDSDDDDFRTLNPTEVHTFSFDTAPEGMTINPNTGFIEWTPTNEQAEGTHEITVKVTDSEQTVDIQTFILTVENVNDLPSIVSPAVLDATEEILYEYNVDSDDDDFRTLNPSEVHSYSLDIGPVGMVIDSSTGVINWTPTNEQAEGTHDVIVKVTDSEQTEDTQTFTITVENVNDLPSIVSTAVSDATEEVLYTYDVESDDDDFRTVNPTEIHTFSLDIAPVGMNIDELTGSISWTPTNEQSEGKHEITVKVTDISDVTDTQTFKITVENANDNPIIDSNPINTATEETLYTYDVSSDDDDFRTLNPSENHAYSLDIAPDGMTIDALSGIIDWVPTNEQAEGTHEVIVSVIDSENAVDTQSFTITVENVNDVPSIVSLPIENATEEELYRYDVNSDDDDFRTLNPSEVHTFSLETAPEGMIIDETTGVIWVPTNEQSEGSHTITIKVTDITGVFDIQTFDISVENVNDPPKIISNPITIATEELLYTYDLESDDDDFHTLNPSEIHSYLLEVAPDGMVINETSGIISWIPTNEQSEGSHIINVKVTDNENVEHIQIFSIEVDNVNDDPIINSIPVTEAVEEVLYTYDIDSDDDDFRTLNPSETHTFSLDLAPEGMIIERSSGLISWIPANEQSEGTHQITVKVTDSENSIITQTFQITVANVNDEPILNSTPITDATEEILYTYDVDSDDDDFRTLNPTEVHTFSLDVAPEGMTINPNTGYIEWTPTNEQAEGDHKIKIMVTDSEQAVNMQSFTLSVENVNDEPSIVTDAILDATEEILYEYDVDSDDDDFRTLNPSEVHTFSLDTAPKGMKINDNTGLISWIPTNEQAEGRRFT